MKEYIEKDAVFQIIAAQCGECADTCLEFDGIQPDCNQCLLHGAAKIIGTVPSSDVRPVVRGRWIRPTRVPDSMLDECSVCGFDTGAYTFNFCPNCGADMRGES